MTIDCATHQEKSLKGSTRRNLCVDILSRFKSKDPTYPETHENKNNNNATHFTREARSSMRLAMGVPVRHQRRSASRWKAALACACVFLGCMDPFMYCMCVSHACMWLNPYPPTQCHLLTHRERGAVVDGLRLVEDDPAPGDGQQALALGPERELLLAAGPTAGAGGGDGGGLEVAGEGLVGRQHHVVALSCDWCGWEKMTRMPFAISEPATHASKRTQRCCTWSACSLSAPRSFPW